RLERGARAPRVERINYVLEQAVEQLKEFRQLLLVGAAVPISYFAAPGKNGALISPECKVHTVARPGEDYAGALEMLEDALSLRGSKAQAEKEEHPQVPGGEVSLSGLATAVAALLPENAIVVDESMTSGRDMMAATRDRKSTRLNSSHVATSYAVFCLKKKK